MDWIVRRGPFTATQLTGKQVAFWLLIVLAACNRPAPESTSSQSTIPTADHVVEESDDKASDKGLTLPPPRVLLDAPEFQLTDQLGNSFGTKELDGQIWVVDFIFTRCTATCPRQTEVFRALQTHARRWPDWSRVRLVSITVDPEYDTAARLHEYAESHQADHEHWKFLTGNRAELVAISKNGFKLPVSEDTSDPAVPITHSSKFILVDSQRRIRGYYDGLADEDFRKLLIDMRLVLSEPGQTTTEPIHVAVPSDVFDPPWMEQRQAEQFATHHEIKAFHDFKFAEAVKSSGITFVSRGVTDVTRKFKKNHYDHACGLAVADVDGDGLHDIYFVSQVGGNQLWRNLGAGRFENITEAADVALLGRVSVSASFADTDNDGDPDLFVTTTRHGNAFFQNDGQGRFRNVTKEAGLEYVGHSSSAEFFDYNHDGKLDLFVTNVGVFTTNEVAYSGEPESEKFPYYSGMQDAFGGHLFSARSETSILYRNEGDNQFRDVTKEVGLVDRGWSGDATPFDVNCDGWMDLYVLNMQGNDQCFVSQNGERFIGMADNYFARPVWGGMGVKSLDFNNDSWMDLFITNMHADMWEIQDDIIGPREKEKASKDRVPPPSYLLSRGFDWANVYGNALYQSAPDGKMTDVAETMNAENYWPWGLSVGDLNADGFEDAFVTSCMNYPFRYHVNSLLLNDHGQKFQDAEFILGVEPRADHRSAAPWFELDCSGRDKDHELAAGRKGKIVVWGAVGSRSSAIFDLDQDGDLDIVTNDFHTAPMVLMSNLSERKPDFHFLKIELRGKRANRDGLGAKVQVDTADQTFTRIHEGQSGYLSQSSLPIYFGLGAADTVKKITVVWPGGNTQELSGPIAANQQLVIEEV